MLDACRDEWGDEDLRHVTPRHITALSGEPESALIDGHSEGSVFFREGEAAKLSNNTITPAMKNSRRSFSDVAEIECVEGGLATVRPAEIKTTKVKTSGATNAVNDEETFNGHLQRALRMNQRLGQMQNEAGVARNVLDFLPMAIITVNKECQVENSNNLAHKIIASSKLLSINEGVLRPSAAQHKVSFKKIVLAALSAKDNTKCTIKLADETRQEVLSVFAVKTTQQIAPSSLGSAPQEYCTLFIVSNFLPDYVNAKVLRELYQLTPAEARLAHMLVSGDALTDIAEKLGVSHNTVRNQLKSVFSKTGTKRQAELVGLILSTPANPDFPDVSSLLDKNQQTRKDRIGSKKVMLLDNGHEIHYFDIGDANGKPVLYLHEFVAWDWWNLIGQDKIALQGVRLIVPLRPGYLGSHLDSELSFESWCSDIGCFLNDLKVKKVVSMGFSSGGAFAASLAFYLPERCERLVLISSTAPVGSISEMDTARPAMSRLVLGFAKHAPRVYQRFFRALLKTVKANPQNYIRDYIKHWSAYDARLVSDPFILQSLTDRFADCIDTGGAGLIRESVVLTQNWGFDLADITVPTHLWSGAEDHALPYMMHEKLCRIPDCEVTKIEGAGHLMIYTCWREIFRSCFP